MRLIDADALMDEANSDGAYGYVDAKQISEAQTIDAVPVVRCRECKYSRINHLIKGKFVATIEIDIAVDENTPNLLPFEELNEAVHNEMEIAVKDMLCEEFGDIATVKVTKTFADLYRTEDKHETV